MSASELLLLKKSFERLNSQYRGAEDKIAEFRDKLREARIEIASKDRQLDAARKLLTKLGSERSELALVAEQSRELTRSLEAKLSLSHDAPELQAKLHRSKRKIADLTAQLHEAQTRLLMCEEAGHQQAAELAVLRKALTGGLSGGLSGGLGAGVRGELSDGGLSGGLGSGYDGQAQLLQALAKSQEESASLAAQLAEGNRRAAALEQQVAHLEGELDRSVGARVAAEETLGLARREAAEAAERAAELQADLDELKSQLRRTSARLQEVQAARQAVEEALDALSAKHRALRDKMGSTEREARAQVESLRADLRNLAGAAEAEVAELQQQHSSREGEWAAQVAALRRQAGEAEARLAQAGRDHEVDLLRLQSRAGALEASLEGSRLREASLEREAEALREEVTRLGRHNGELAANLAAARNEAEAFSERAEEAVNNTDTERRLRMQVQAQLESSLTRAAVREEQLAAEAGVLRNDLAAASLTHERIRAELKTCQEKLSDALARQGVNERHIEELHATIQSLTKSKTKLQNTMLEQLSLFKSKLQQVEQENLTLRTALTSVSAAARGGGGGGGAAGPRVARSPPTPSTETHVTLRSGLGIFSTSSGSGVGGSLSQTSGGDVGAATAELTAVNLAAANAARAAEKGGGQRPRISGGGSLTTTTNSSILTPMMSLRDAGQGTSGGGGAGGGGGGGGTLLFRAESSSLGNEDSRVEGPLEATLAPYRGQD